MLSQRKTFWISVAQLLCGIAMYPLFCCWIEWLGAMTRETALDHFPGQSLSNCLAFIDDHGRLREWRLGTITQNPVSIGGCTTALVAVLGFLISSAFYVEKQRQPVIVPATILPE